MWRKKKWIIVSVVAAVVILAVGVIGGIAYAQTPGTSPDGTPTGNPLMAKVAKILNINQADLEKAFNQAQKEMRDEALKARMDSLVKEGKLTQEQADNYQKWLQSRPDVPPGLDAQPKAGPRGFMGPRVGFRCFPRPFGPPPAASPAPTN